MGCRTTVDALDNIIDIGAKTDVPGRGSAYASLPGAFEPETRASTTVRDSLRAFIADNGLLEHTARALPPESVGRRALALTGPRHAGWRVRTD